MSKEDTITWLRRLLRATFPYLVFIFVFIFGTVLIVFWAGSEELEPGKQETVPLLPNAHSHNDYERERPLLDALALGFCSVEADIYLVEGRLLVAHDRDRVDPARTLDALYLKPLWTRFEANGGSIYPEAAPFTLLIDIKSNGAETFLVLDRELGAYAPMLTTFTKEHTEPRAVTVIISGDRAVETILASTPRRAGIDGRLSDLEGTPNPNEMPLISDNWLNHFTWRGKGEMPEGDTESLRTALHKAHGLGIRVRFWAIPQSETVWGRLHEEGVDLLNADRLDKLHALLTAKPVAAR